ncbi:MAG: hypothetical protein R3251_01080 [Candidatus Spechtbacterales bacterium]|nr:hypothetical protein [Candidatus Spechtbacterales bacterium]
MEYRLVNHKGHLLRASTGTEIVREGNFCPEHIEEAQNREPVLLDQDPKIVVSKI